MRPMRMNFRAVLLALAAVTLPAALSAQATAGAPPFTPFKDASLLKAPAGHPVAIIEFEDLECPACANASPVVHTAIDHYKIPYERYDFPLSMHIWSKDAAITARYLQDKVSPEAGDWYRKDVFANQRSISSKDDYNNFTKRWFDQRKLQIPFVMDPSGRFAAEVQADFRMGERLGLVHTPTIVVVGPKGYTEVTDVTQLYTVIDKAEEDAKAKPVATAAHNNLKRPRTAQN